MGKRITNFRKIKKNIINLENDEVSKPIKLKNGYLLIKLNDKREFKEEIDIDKEVNEKKRDK